MSLHPSLKNTNEVLLIFEQVKYSHFWGISRTKFGAIFPSHARKMGCHKGALGRSSHGSCGLAIFNYHPGHGLDPALNPPFPFYGEAMALVAALIFSWTSVFFTTASQKLGVTTVNLLRLPGAALLLGAMHLILYGDIWPANLAWMDQMWIGLSGVVGLAIGDSALLKAFTLIGPRRSMTMMALAPVYTTIIAWSLLGEHLNMLALVGILVVIAGVMTATLGKDKGTGEFSGLSRQILRTGLLLALIGSLGQGVGSVLAKLGMTGSSAGSSGVEPLGATLIRLTWATVFYWLAVIPRLNIRRTLRGLRDRRGVTALAVAICLGPFISVWISLVAIKNTEAGIAQVLLGMVPIFVILPAWLVYRDRPSPLSLFGITIAVGGGALLFLR
jgi:drug/metabolite transporter (DMT)-like permease